MNEETKTRSKGNEMKLAEVHQPRKGHYIADLKAALRQHVGAGADTPVVIHTSSRLEPHAAPHIGGGYEAGVWVPDDRTIHVGLGWLAGQGFDPEQCC